MTPFHRPSRRSVLALMCALMIALMCAGTAGAAAPANGPLVGLIVSDLRNPFFLRIAQVVESSLGRASAAHGRVLVVSSGFDHARQVLQIEEMVAKRVAVLMLTPIEPELVGPYLERARRAGIRVVALDANAASADVTVTTDNFAAGTLACRYLADRLGGQGEVAIIHGPRNSAVTDRVLGCRQALQASPRLTIVSESLNGGASKEGGLERMTRLLSDFPRLRGVFAINDPTALGAEFAARTAGRSEVVITAVDGSPEVVRRLADPTSQIVATYPQRPAEMARTASRHALELLAGQHPPARVLLTAAEVLTADNVRAYAGW